MFEDDPDMERLAEMSEHTGDVWESKRCIVCPHDLLGEAIEK